MWAFEYKYEAHNEVYDSANIGVFFFIFNF